MRALDVMQRDVKTVTPGTSIARAVHLMITLRISGMPVVNSAGEVVGILSEGDLIRRVELGTDLKIPAWQAWFVGPEPGARAYIRSHALKVGEVMTAPVVSVSPDTELSEVVALMESRRIKRVPVIARNRLVGILTRSDLLRALERLLPSLDTPPVADAELRRRLLAELGGQQWTPRFSIDVRVENGVVELRGVVTNERERAAMCVLAESVPGVREVVDHLLWVEQVSGAPMPNPNDD
jgi:CBS domain-containing protein